MASVFQSFRATSAEYTAINAAAKALRVPRSELIQDAVVAAGHKLGIYAGAPTMPPPRSRPWPDTPDRGVSSCTERMTLSFTTITYEILRLMAQHVGLTGPHCAIGATLRYIADLQKHPQLLTACDKLDPKDRPDLKALAAVELPEQYLT